MQQVSRSWKISSGIKYGNRFAFLPSENCCSAATARMRFTRIATDHSNRRKRKQFNLIRSLHAVLFPSREEVRLDDVLVKDYDSARPVAAEVRQTLLSRTDTPPPVANEFEDHVAGNDMAKQKQLNLWSSMGSSRPLASRRIPSGGRCSIPTIISWLPSPR